MPSLCPNYSTLPEQKQPKAEYKLMSVAEFQENFIYEHRWRARADHDLPGPVLGSSKDKLYNSFPVPLVTMLC